MNRSSVNRGPKRLTNCAEMDWKEALTQISRNFSCSAMDTDKLLSIEWKFSGKYKLIFVNFRFVAHIISALLA